MAKLSLARLAERNKEQNIALSLYANVAEETVKFRQANPLKLIWLDPVRLNDQMALGQMTSENGGVFQWLLHQEKFS